MAFSVSLKYLIYLYINSYNEAQILFLVPVKKKPTKTSPILPPHLTYTLPYSLGTRQPGLCHVSLQMTYSVHFL